jgi:hypothetical protein
MNCSSIDTSMSSSNRHDEISVFFFGAFLAATRRRA